MAGGEGTPASAVPPDPDRIFLLECRLEQLHAALDDARAEADHARERLAEAAGREADHLRRQTRLQEEIASAREEVMALHRRLEHSEALRAELGGHLYEAGAHDDVDELARLRKEVLQERQRAAVHERTLSHLRSRVEELVASRETLLTRVAEWQRLVRHGDHDAIDLAEFIAALRQDILELEHRNHLGERREAGLREQLERVRADAKAAGGVTTRGRVSVAAGETVPSGRTAEPGVARVAGAVRPAGPAGHAEQVDVGAPIAGPAGATAEPTEVADASETAGATGATTMAEPTDGAEPREVAEVSEPTEATRAGEPWGRRGAGEATGLDEATEVSEPTEAVGATGAGEVSDPVGATGVVVMAGQADPSAPVDASMPLEATAPAAGGRADELAAALAAAESPEVQAELLLELGRCGEVEASYAIRPWATAKESRVRAAAYEALGRLLERDPSRLEPHVRWGLADADPRVRRRVVLAAATARGLSLRPLLEPLRGDPDAQVRRVVQEVLKRAPPEEPGAPTTIATPLARPAPTGVPS